MNASSVVKPTSPVGVAEVLEELLGSQPGHLSRPRLTYLRRKAGRGLVAIYGSAGDPSGPYTVTVDEAACSAHHRGGSVRQQWHGEWPGIVQDLESGVTVQSFPSDRGLPELTAAMSPTPNTELWRALESAGRQLITEPDGWRLTSATAESVRYKPGDRCVIRYRLGFALRVADGSGSQQVNRTIIGKLYRSAAQAKSAAALMDRLWARQARERSWVARSLGVLEPIALTLSEDLGTSTGDPATMAGTDVIRPANSRSMHAIRLAARALAELHTSTLADGTQQLRTGADEALKAAKRSKVLQAYAPGMAEHIDQVAAELCETLSALRTDRSRPAHGSFKPSQLLCRADSVFVVDFDQFCLADPALDVGYFLAYLRPPGLWYGRAGARAWFRRAARTFLGAYGDALHQHGVAPSTSSEIVSRSAVYEAALLLKITTRRANRLHSPRPAEIEAMMSEISDCLAGGIGSRHDGGRSGGERQGGFDPVE